MSLSSPAPRNKLHTRHIHCEGFQREDGLWDIEATLVDTKTYSYTNHDRGIIEAGEPVHEMQIRLTLDLDMTIHQVDVDLPYTPFRICPYAGINMQKLVGLKIASGWRREIRRRIPNTDSCTHLIELLGPVSTTAYQTMHFAMENRAAKQPKRATPPILNQCHSLASNSAVVKVMWPEFYTGE